VIKDYPELTVGSYLQSKIVKEQYLNSIKPKEDLNSDLNALNTACKYK